MTSTTKNPKKMVNFETKGKLFHRKMIRNPMKISTDLAGNLRKTKAKIERKTETEKTSQQFSKNTPNPTFMPYLPGMKWLKSQKSSCKPKI